MALLDQFIPHPDVRERHEIVVHATAGHVMETARDFDIQSLCTVRAIFWLRAKLLGAKMAERPPQGLIADMLALGWGRLAEEPDRYFIGGAVCQPWKADVVFTPVPAVKFAAFAAGDVVKIAWTLEVDPMGPDWTRLSTETRAVATSDLARRKFQSYWRKYHIGIVFIRILLLRAVRRQATILR